MGRTTLARPQCMKEFDSLEMGEGGRVGVNGCQDQSHVLEDHSGCCVGNGCEEGRAEGGKPGEDCCIPQSEG